jgi:DNA-binding response OmpR family regulator
VTEVVRVVVIDDDELQLELLERGLRRDGFDVRSGARFEDVATLAAGFEPHVLVLDVNVGATSGVEGMRRAREAAPTARVVLLSASDESTLRRIAREVRADGWLTKSMGVADLSKRLRELSGI